MNQQRIKLTKKITKIALLFQIVFLKSGSATDNKLPNKKNQSNKQIAKNTTNHTTLQLLHH